MFGKERKDSSLNSVHTFTLGDNESITKVILRTTDHLDKITFFSNFEKHMDLMAVMVDMTK